MGKLFGRKHTAACAENNIAAVIVFNDSRLNIFAGKIRNGVHMRNEADCGAAFTAGCCCNGGINIAFIINPCVFNADCVKLFYKKICKVKLSFSRGDG